MILLSENLVRLKLQGFAKKELEEKKGGLGSEKEKERKEQG